MTAVEQSVTWQRWSRVTWHNIIKNAKSVIKLGFENKIKKTVKHGPEQGKIS